MANEDQIWRMLHAELTAGRDAVVCSVIRSRGSTPREAGARMLVGETGLLAGTVGGGCGEADVAVLARKVLAGFAEPGVCEVDLSGDFDQTQIQACGGSMEVLVERLGAKQLPITERLAEAEANRSPLWLVQQLSSAASGGAWHLHSPGMAEDGIPGPVRQALEPAPDSLLLTVEGVRWFAQAVGAREEVVIVGSGHVAQPLCRMATLLGWRVVVVDDRPGYATAARFPGAVVHVGQHARVLADLKPGRRSHVVIITRGHEHDEASLREALRHDPAYVGMIGSKRRAIGTLKRLAEDGFAKERLSRVHTPIGLDIGAQTPEEIALAVMAEIVCRHRAGTGRPLGELRPGGV